MDTGLQLGPLLSVIIPVYNVSDYLPQCLDSVIGQTYRNLEIILVNDGSTDQSPSICDAYAQKDERIRVIHKENGGLSSARNAGMAIMTGEFVTFVDSDDWLELDAYDHCMQAFIQDNTLDVVRGEYRECFPSGEYNDHKTTIPSPGLIRQTDLLDTYLKQTVLVAVVWSSIYRVSSLRALNLKFIEGLHHEDEYFTGTLYTCTQDLKLWYTHQILYNYRREREGAITYNKRNLKTLQQLCQGYLSVYEQCQIHAKPEAFAKINYYIVTIISSVFNQLRSNYTEDELISTVKQLCQVARKYPMLEKSNTWQLRLFLLSPWCWSRFLKFYNPIARKLGI